MSKIFILFCMAITLAACSTAQQQAAQSAQVPGGAVIAQQSKLLASDGAVPKTGDVAPDFQFTLPNGTIKLSDLHGKKVLVNFWATWCGPCQEEMPAIQKAHEQYGDDLTIIGVNKAEDVDAIVSFTKDMRVTFPLVLDPDSDIAYRYGARNLPMSFFINTDGTINQVKLGVMNDSFIEQQVQALK